MERQSGPKPGACSPWAWLAVFGLASLVVLAGDRRSWSLMQNTLLLAGLSTAISLPAGTLLAWLLVRTDLPGRRVFLAVLAAMVFVPLYLQAAAWQAGFGLQGSQAGALGTPPLLGGLTGAAWIHAMAALPWVVLLAGAGFRLIEPELEEQALLDGSSLQVFARVSLPAARGLILVAGVWVAIVAAGEMTVTDLLLVRTYAEEIYTQIAVGPQPGEPPPALLPGVGLCGWLVLAGLLVAARLAPGDRPPSLRPPRRFALGRWRLPALILLVLVLVMAAGVPLGSLLYKAGVVVTQTEAGRVRSWSALKCLAIAAESPWRYRRELGWSLAIGTLAATAATAVAAVLAWLARRGGPRTTALLVLTAALLALPGPVVGLGLIHLLNQPEAPLLVRLYDQSILAPWLALLLRSLGPATLILWHAFRFVPAEVLDAAAVDGAGPAARLWHVVLPATRTALAVAWLVALAVALGDLAASILVVPPGVTTLSIRIFGLLHYGVEDQVAGISLALVAMLLVPAVLVIRLATRRAAHPAGGDRKTV